MLMRDRYWQNETVAERVKSCHALNEFLLVSTHVHELGPPKPRYAIKFVNN